MKVILLAITIVFCISSLKAQNKTADTIKISNGKSLQVVEAACGQCQFGLPGKSCDLAVRINGKAYFVDGTSIDEHGDAHATDGFCKAIRKAEVKGEIVKDRFTAGQFKLLPNDTIKHDH